MVSLSLALGNLPRWIRLGHATKHGEKFTRYILYINSATKHCRSSLMVVGIPSKVVGSGMTQLMGGYVEQDTQCFCIAMVSL